MHPSAATAVATHRRLTRYALVGGIGTALFLGLLALVEFRWGPLARLDHHWDDALHRYARQHTAWTASMQTLADIGGTVTMRVALLAVAAWLWAVGARVLALWAAAQALLGWAANWALKGVIGRPRPHFADPVSHASGGSFPSGHAMASAITCGALAALIWPVAGRALRIGSCTTAAIAVLAVGWTRIALGVHWPSDVVAGWLGAVATLGLITAAVELWRPGALVRDLVTVDRRTRPRVQRVLVRGGGPRPVGDGPDDAGPEDDGPDDGPDDHLDDRPGENDDAGGGAGTNPGGGREDGNGDRGSGGGSTGGASVRRRRG
ncbi:phosphatase PAP2 family protein [Kitasatospora sp. NPDC059571]|uniref:phosphatase PAP2 family protein n=1 Tax=Kitasatospora sp. NPDC059571 TaxID=3346871 RepID=UPI0036817D3D